VSLQPLSITAGQSPPAATTPAPGPHTGSLEVRLRRLFSTRRL